MPLLLFFLRYVQCINYDSYMLYMCIQIKFYIDQVRMEESLVQDLTGMRILTKYIENMSHIQIFLCTKTFYTHFYKIL
ncbi:hypothetical protein E2986_12178 [Frieseomelitta varia]|uniref:Uncharacterized protein n=1 Tax=Frieseomelitta varia TaxID=561572 RepID=A0A833WA81_9HYME|nr:hypothetical protein E2986_12178 [Frieseomelitta varia]